MEGGNFRGWVIDGIRVHPVEAYTRVEHWLGDFEWKFPEKAKRMRVYSKAQGWSPIAHLVYWPQALIGWLNKQSQDGEG